MSQTLAKVRALVARRKALVSRHGYTKLVASAILLKDIVAGLDAAIVVEVYPDAERGPSVLVLQYDADSRPVHVVWGIPKDAGTPAVVVTAYRPDSR